MSGWGMFLWRWRQKWDAGRARLVAEGVGRRTYPAAVSVRLSRLREFQGGVRRCRDAVAHCTGSVYAAAATVWLYFFAAGYDLRAAFSKGA